VPKKPQSKGQKKEDPPVRRNSKNEDGKKALRSRVGKASTKPGVYRWLDKNGQILYIGKAKNLKNRLKSYVQKEPDKTLGPWKLALIERITDVDMTITHTELEALILETNLIKEQKPKYNVMMKDDKNYVYVRITMKDSYPTVTVVRQIEDDGAKYFGPFLSAHHIKRTLDMLHDVHAFRSCKRSIDMLNKDPDAECKPCLDSQIGKCNGLCAGKVTKEEYREAMEAAMQFFKGNRKGVLEKLKEKMAIAAEKKHFEDAAKLRDTLKYVESLEAQQVVSDTSGANTDVFGVAMLSGRSHVVVLRERDGKLIGERSYTLAGQADTQGEILAQFIPQYYQATNDVPETLIMAEEPTEQDVLIEWLVSLKGKKVTIHVPARGKKSKLLVMAEENADEKIKQQLATWEAETKKVEEALTELKNVLDLQEKPKRIECYDISHLGGTETVGSMVVFVGGKAENKQYRSFTIRTMKKGEIDDYKALKEVLSRRLRHLAGSMKSQEEQWTKQGITFGKAKKADQEFIEETMKENEEFFHLDDINYKDFMVARYEENIVGFGRLYELTKKVIELKSMWVHESWQGKKLGQFLAQKMLNKTKEKVYVTIHPKWESYYTQLGFRWVDTPPEIITKEMSEAKDRGGNFLVGIVMVSLPTSRKEDSSLKSIPDLLVLDGGKGQLSAGVEILKAAKIDIPIISIAKREEEIFLPGERTSIALKKDSEALFLIMRLRDEAHRSANRHREKRLKSSLLSS
jgi:excinuclease ABC subunit C